MFRVQGSGICSVNAVMQRELYGIASTNQYQNTHSKACDCSVNGIHKCTGVQRTAAGSSFKSCNREVNKTKAMSRGLPVLEQPGLLHLLPIGCCQRPLCWDAQSTLSHQQSVPSLPEQHLVLFQLRCKGKCTHAGRPCTLCITPQ